MAKEGERERERDVLCILREEKVQIRLNRFCCCCCSMHFIVTWIELSWMKWRKWFLWAATIVIESKSRQNHPKLILSLCTCFPISLSFKPFVSACTNSKPLPLPVFYVMCQAGIYTNNEKWLLFYRDCLIGFYGHSSRTISPLYPPHFFCVVQSLNFSAWSAVICANKRFLDMDYM